MCAFKREKEFGKSANKAADESDVYDSQRLKVKLHAWGLSHNAFRS